MGDKRRVKRAQTWERGPPSAPAEMSLFFVLFVRFQIRLTKIGQIRLTKIGRKGLTKIDQIKLTKIDQIRLTKIGQIRLTKIG